MRLPWPVGTVTIAKAAATVKTPAVISKATKVLVEVFVATFVLFGITIF